MLNFVPDVLPFQQARIVVYLYHELQHLNLTLNRFLCFWVLSEAAILKGFFAVQVVARLNYISGIGVENLFYQHIS